MTWSVWLRTLSYAVRSVAGERVFVQFGTWFCVSLRGSVVFTLGIADGGTIDLLAGTFVGEADPFQIVGGSVIRWAGKRKGWNVPQLRSLGNAIGWYVGGFVG